MNGFLQLLWSQTWQIAVLVVAVSFVTRTVAKNRPHLAHALWMLVLIKCVTPPIWGHSLGLFSQLQAMWKADPIVQQELPSDEPLLMPQGDTDNEIAMVPPADDPMPRGLIAMNDSEVASTPNVPITLPTKTADSSFIPEATPWKPSWPMILLSLLAIGAVMTLSAMIVRCVLCLRHICQHRTTEFDESLNEQLQRLSKKLRLRRVPRIIVSDVLFGPAVIGLWRHVIVLPRCLIRAESPVEEQSRGASEPGSKGETSELRSHSPMPARSTAPLLSTLDPILAHELLHIRRGDLRTGTLQAVVQSLWWFHPAVWLCNRWLSREAERCCDEQVIAELGCSPAQYARSLLSVIESKHALQPIPVFPGMKPVEITSQRMERIMSLKSKLIKQTPLWCWLAVAVLAIVVLPGAVAKPATDEQVSIAENESEGRGEAAYNIESANIPAEPGVDRNPADAADVAIGPVDERSTANPADNETPSNANHTRNSIDEENNVAMPSSVSEPLVKLDTGRSGDLVTSHRPVPTANGEASDPLLKLVWETRESIRKRLLSAEAHTPWQIMSGVEGLRRDMLLKVGDKTVNALEWIQAGPQYQGEPWFEKTEHGGRAHPYSKPYWFEGHVNQFLSKFAAGRLPLETQFQTSDGPITIQNMIDHAKMVVNDKEEVSWTLLALCRYLPPDAKWTNAKGEEWSIEKLVEIEVSRRVGGPTSPNGGTDGLYALSVARNEYLKTGKPLEGVWLKADEKIRRYIDIAKSQQNTDGTLSSDFFRSNQRKEQFDRRLSSTGHLLQFLMHAVSNEQLNEDWIRQAVQSMAYDIQAHRREFVACDPLFTATAALTTYLERVTGKVSAAVRDGVPNQLHQPDAALDDTERQKQNLVISYGVANLVTPVAKTAVDPVNAANAVAAGTLPEPPQAAEVTRRKNQLVVRNYKVADLVVRGSMGLNTLEPSTTLPNKVDEGVSKHVPETEPRHAFGPRVLNVSFQPLTELIKTTIQPESWNDKEGVIEAGIFVEDNEPGEFLLSVRQTAAVHEEIEDLLSALRADLNQIVVISCRVMKIATDSQIKGLEERSSLHTLGDGQRWALLTKSRIDELQKFLTDENAEVLACPRIVTPSGQAALVEIGAEAQSIFQGFRLSANPHLIADSSVIRLSHSVSIGEIASDPSPAQTESLMSSGQTLLLLIEAPQKVTADEESVAASTGRFLILLTAEKLEEQEETVK